MFHAAGNFAMKALPHMLEAFGVSPLNCQSIHKGNSARVSLGLRCTAQMFHNGTWARRDGLQSLLNLELMSSHPPGTTDKTQYQKDVTHG